MPLRAITGPRHRLLRDVRSYCCGRFIPQLGPLFGTEDPPFLFLGRSLYLSLLRPSFFGPRLGFLANGGGDCDSLGLLPRLPLWGSTLFTPQTVIRLAAKIRADGTPYWGSALPSGMAQ